MQDNVRQSTKYNISSTNTARKRISNTANKKGKKTISKLKILSTNADILNNKKSELETIIKQKDVDIILICETLSKKQSASLPPVPVIYQGYDTLEDNTGRGVTIIYKDFLELSIIKSITDIYSPAIFVKVTNSSNLLHLGIVYRSPNITKAEDANLNKQISQAAKKLKNLIIYGDFNHPEIDWQHMFCSRGEEHPASAFLYTIQDSKLDQLTTEPTHYKPNCRPSLIDLILTNNKEILDAPTQLPPLGKSHHVIQLNNILYQKNDPHSNIKIKKYQVSKGNYTAINSELKSVDWESELCDQNIDSNSAWDKISTKIKELRDKHVPSILVSVARKKKPAALNNSLLHLIREKRWYFKRYKKYRNQRNLQLYHIARAQVNKYLRLQKKNKEIKIANQTKNNPKAFYQFISSKTTKKDNIPDLVKEDGSKTTTDAEKSAELNKFFCSVFTREDTSNMPHMLDK